MITVKRAMVRGLGAALGLTLAATLWCASGQALVNPQVPPPGKSDLFNQGYVDGCRTGFQDAGRDGYQLAGRRDDQLYAAAGDYKAGFDEAYHACYVEQQRNPRMMGEPGGAGGRN